MKSDPQVTRRNFLATAGGTIVSIGLPGVFVKLMDSENRALAAETRADGHPRIPPGQHGVKALPNMGGVKGPGNVPGWRLVIEGEVQNPLTLKFQDLMKLKQTDLTCDVHCVTGWTLLDARWRGIPMSTVWSSMMSAAIMKAGDIVIRRIRGRRSALLTIEDNSISFPG